MNNKLILFLLFLSILSLGLVSGLSDDAGTTIDFVYPDSTNYSTINVNDSIYWDGNAWSDTRWLNIDGSNANQNIDIGAWNVSATEFVGGGSGLTGISSVSVGTDNQIPYVNAAGDDFLYDTGLKYEKKDGYLVLDGVNDIVSIPDSAALSVTDDLTVFLWVKGASQGRIFMSHYDYGAGQRAWVVSGGDGGNSDHLYIIISDDGSYDAGHLKRYTGTDTVVLDNTWHSAAFTFEGGDLKLFVDGIEQTTLVKDADDAITTIHDCTKSLVIGNYWNNEPTFGGSWFNGGLDNAMVIDRVLTPAEITTLHNSGRDTVYTDANLQGNWQFNDGTADDSTANAGDGTLIGGHISGLSSVRTPKVMTNELSVEGGDLSWKRLGLADFVIESLDHEAAALTLKRTGSAYYDWRIRNEGGNLNFEYSTDDTANWIESLVIQYDATLAYEGLLQVTRDSFPVTKFIREYDGSATAWVSELQVTGTPAAGKGAGFLFTAPDSTGARTVAGLFGGGLSTITNGAEAGYLRFAPAWHGADPASRTDMVMTATGVATSDLELTGTTVISDSNISTTGTIKGANYQSGDGSAGITQSETGVTDFDIVIKDGLITSFTKNA